MLGSLFSPLLLPDHYSAWQVIQSGNSTLQTLVQSVATTERGHSLLLLHRVLPQKVEEKPLLFPGTPSPSPPWGDRESSLFLAISAQLFQTPTYFYGGGRCKLSGFQKPGGGYPLSTCLVGRTYYICPGHTRKPEYNSPHFVVKIQAGCTVDEVSPMKKKKASGFAFIIAFPPRPVH